MKMGMNSWEREGVGLRKTFPLISSVKMWIFRTYVEVNIWTVNWPSETKNCCFVTQKK